MKSWYARPWAVMPSVVAVVAVLGLSGCAAVSVAGAVVGAAVSVTGAVVSTGVEVTGKVVGAGIDAVTPTKKPETPAAD